MNILRSLYLLRRSCLLRSSYLRDHLASIFVNILVIGVVWLSSVALAAPTTLDEFRIEKRFGIGVSAGGPLSTLGLEADINLTPYVTLSGGIGTGLDYSTLMAKTKYFLLGRSVSPYFAFGFARWWTDGTNEQDVSPSVLRNKFLRPLQNLKDGFSVHLFYPAVGVQFLHRSGLSFYAELQYLFQMFSLANGTYAGTGVQWFF